MKQQNETEKLIVLGRKYELARKVFFKWLKMGYYLGLAYLGLLVFCAVIFAWSIIK